MRRDAVVILALGLAGGLTLGFVSQRSADRAGQLVFVPGVDRPTPSVLEEALAPSSGDWSLTIRECEQLPTGLEVRGRLDGPSGGAVTVVVAGGDPQGSGVRTGRDFAASAHPGEAAPGDFRVVLPWAARASTFAVVGAGDAGEAFVECP